MNRRRRDRVSRHAAVIAVNMRWGFVMNDQAVRTKAAQAWEQMRRQAEEFELPAAGKFKTESVTARDNDLPAVNGTGHAGAQ
jgi:hypothetical protein